jgi:hypothetical protein
VFRSFCVGIFAGIAGSALADDFPDKSKYTLFNPTPRELMREMSTDRPDKTESAYTVDAGHFQIESDLVAYQHDRDTAGGADLRGDRLAFLTLNLKAGLCNSSDFQVVLFPYSRLRTDDRIQGTIANQSGFGDVLTRLKINLWGNDGGASALAVMPYVKWPASQDHLGNGAIEGGIILPWAIKLPAGFGLGGMEEFDWLRDEIGSGYHSEFVNTITISHEIFGKLDGFVEFFSLVSAESGAPWVGTFDFGITYEFTANMHLDGGAYIGLTKSATDLAPFLGFSVRF